jgi:solute carrier family 25 (mitochondrial thiamine pyrophosphate transporter), member 19
MTNVQYVYPYLPYLSYLPYQGAAAGAIARLLTAPFDVLKIRYQLGQGRPYASVLGGFKSIIQQEGFFSLWKGNLSATYLWMSYAMVQFSVYGSLKRFGENLPVPGVFAGVGAPFETSSAGPKLGSASAYQASPESSPSASNGHRLWKTLVLFLAGAGAGIAATMATYPFDIMRTQFAIQGTTKAFDGMRSFVSHTFRTNGISGKASSASNHTQPRAYGLRITLMFTLMLCLGRILCWVLAGGDRYNSLYGVEFCNIRIP